MSNQDERNVTLDIAKGIAIILMVIGHCYSTNNAVLTMIYGFHMPAFFMISGIIFGMKLQSDENYKFNVSHIAVNFLRPYLKYSTLFALFLFMLKMVGREENLARIGAGYVWNIISLKGVSALWYLPCILLTELIFIFVNKFCKRLLVPISVGAYLIALCIKVKSDGELIVLWRSFAGFFYFMIGYCIPTWGNKRRINISNKRMAAIWGIITVLYVILSIKNGMVTLVALRFNNPLLYTVNAILGCVALLLLSELLSTRAHTWCVNVLIGVGRKTLYILGIHMFVVEMIRLVDYKLFGNTLNKLGVFEGIVFGSIVCSVLYGLYVVNRKIKKREF